MNIHKAIFLGVVWCSPLMAARAATVDAIRAVVGDTVITLQQVLERTQAQEEGVYAVATTEPQSETDRRIRELRQDEFKMLVDRQVVLQEFKRLAKEKGAKIPDAYVDEQVQRIVRTDPRYNGDRVLFDKHLEAEGLTREEFWNNVRDDITYDIMVREFVKDPIISPLKVETYYQNHQSEFTLPARVKLHWIQRFKSAGETNGATGEMMKEIQSQIKDGAGFDDLAKNYSQGEQHDDEWRELSTLSDAFKDQLANLKKGQCTGVIETPQSYLILQVTDIEGAHVTPLKDARDKITAELTDQERNERRADWINKLKARILVRVL
jgi:parvulin-like peptidyl-prolyl isomerase